jgi:hypothetical protein
MFITLSLVVIMIRLLVPFSKVIGRIPMSGSWFAGIGFLDKYVVMKILSRFKTHNLGANSAPFSSVISRLNSAMYYPL